MKKNQPSKDHVKIIFPLERDEDGFPPEDREGIWAVALESGNYRIDNIPFFAMKVSDGDIVSAAKVGDDLVFCEVLAPSENCTIRIIFYDIKAEDRMKNELREMGCSIEGTGIEGLISISVHKDCYGSVENYLSDAFKKEVLDYQEASLR